MASIGLSVSDEVIISHINIEHILPLMTDNRKRSDLRQVDVIEAEDRKHL